MGLLEYKEQMEQRDRKGIQVMVYQVKTGAIGLQGPAGETGQAGLKGEIGIPGIGIQGQKGIVIISSYCTLI